ncbi:MAG: hypothetical protein AMQ74_01822 [Candidatus Methanofastidiosum methylothiophilum]|uniref:Uncharacterized protein n=1 Tax=Candidatus Methanofastidiosum methylothiophilum TaxID=1705564 RepID=A0A150INI9_9EURY|nr:MAG: hypothetical protein AMQ74_01822 [Candidatus Methanofastidiosum methylthiophilus]NMC77268.1 hypothetical protein [Candidatus Methanofastidiosa archaeon]
MRKVEALPYTVEEAINKVVKDLTKIRIEFYTAGREIYINEDLILNKDVEFQRKSIINKIKNYLKNEIEEEYAILSFDDAPNGSYLVIEYSNYATFTTLAKMLNLKPEDEVTEEKHVLQNKDSKLERELKIINRDISGEDIDFEDEKEEDEEEYDYINFGERNCKVCGSVIRRITIHDKEGNIRDGYKCVNTNCLKIYIIR